MGEENTVGLHFTYVTYFRANCRRENDYSIV